MLVVPTLKFPKYTSLVAMQENKMFAFVVNSSHIDGSIVRNDSLSGERSVEKGENTHLSIQCHSIVTSVNCTSASPP